MYKLLVAYAEQFGKDFPISTVKDTASNEYEVIRMIQECIKTNTAYATATTTNTSSST
jgi:hypothetical protein